VRLPALRAEQNIKAGKWVAAVPPELRYSEDQPRDEHGRWTSEGGGDDSALAPGGTTRGIIDDIDASGLRGHDLYTAIATGEIPDTLARFTHTDPQTGEPVLDAARQALHERILAEVTNQPGQDHPQAVFTAGGPASGKSGLYGEKGEANGLSTPQQAVVVDPDAIKAMLPEYQQLIDAGYEDAAAAMVHEEPSQLAFAASQIAMQNQSNIVVDGAGDSAGTKFADKINAAVAQGYDTEVRYANVPTDVAQVRAVARAEGTGESAGRVVDPGLLSAIHQQVSQTFVDTIRDGVPGARVSVYDNTDGMRLVAARDGAGNWDVRDRAAYDAFVAKAGA
jgi:hypothetical protein